MAGRGSRRLTSSAKINTTGDRRDTQMIEGVPGGAGAPLALMVNGGSGDSEDTQKFGGQGGVGPDPSSGPRFF